MTQLDEPGVAQSKLILDESPEATPEFKAAVAQAIRDEFAPTAWKPRAKLRYLLVCPSGQKVLLKHFSTMDLIEANLIEEIDFFTKRLFPADLDAMGNPVEQDDDISSIWLVLKDVDKRARFHSLLNRIMVAGVVRPKIIDDGVEVVEKDGEKSVRMPSRKIQIKDGEVPASIIDFGDRMAIFAELNKPLDQIKPFRPEQIVDVASLESGKSTEHQAE